jgi:hypothetical protein
MVITGRRTDTIQASRGTRELVGIRVLAEKLYCLLIKPQIFCFGINEKLVDLKYFFTRKLVLGKKHRLSLSELQRKRVNEKFLIFIQLGKFWITSAAF